MQILVFSLAKTELPFLKKLAEADRAITRGPHGKALLLEIRLGERSAGLK